MDPETLLEFDEEEISSAHWRNLSETIPIDFIDKHPEFPWDGNKLAHNPGLTLDFIIRHYSRYKKEWRDNDRFYTSPGLSLSDIISLTDPKLFAPHKPCIAKLNYISLASRKDLPLDFIVKHIQSWDKAAVSSLLRYNQDPESILRMFPDSIGALREIALNSSCPDWLLRVAANSTPGNMLVAGGTLEFIREYRHKIDYKNSICCSREIALFLLNRFLKEGNNMMLAEVYANPNLRLLDFADASNYKIMFNPNVTIEYTMMNLSHIDSEYQYHWKVSFSVFMPADLWCYYRRFGSYRFKLEITPALFRKFRNPLRSYI